jgi:hypothetical protein
MSPRSLSRLFAIPAAVAALALAGCSSTGSSSSAGATGKVARDDRPLQQIERFTDDSLKLAARRTGEVYLLRGLMDVFSRGMDEMAAKLNRAGVYALSTSYSNWREIADEIVARNARGQVSHPVIIMGHSLGGNDAPKMASYLGARGIKVPYVVTFDPTEPVPVGRNVGKVVNYYIPNENNRLYRGAGFTGTLDNVNVASMRDVTHTTVEKNSILQSRAIGTVMGMTKAIGPRKVPAAG